MLSCGILCRKLFVSRGGYYAWKTRHKSARHLGNESLLEKIVQVHQATRETHGYPRIHKALQAQGERAGRNRIARLMRDNDIKARKARRFKRHSHRHHLILILETFLYSESPLRSPMKSGWVM